MIKTSPANVVGAHLISGQEAKIPHGLWPKKQNIKQNIVTNSIKTPKMATSKKKNLKKKKMEEEWDTQKEGSCVISLHPKEC